MLLVAVTSFCPGNKLSSDRDPPSLYLFQMGPLGWRKYPAHTSLRGLCPGVSRSRVVCIVFFHNRHFVVMPRLRSAVTIVFQMFIGKQAFFVSVPPLKRQMVFLENSSEKS